MSWFGFDKPVISALKHPKIFVLLLVIPVRHGKSFYLKAMAHVFYSIELYFTLIRICMDSVTPSIVLRKMEIVEIKLIQIKIILFCKPLLKLRLKANMIASSRLTSNMHSFIRTKLYYNGNNVDPGRKTR